MTFRAAYDELKAFGIKLTAVPGEYVLSRSLMELARTETLEDALRHGRDIGAINQALRELPLGPMKFPHNRKLKAIRVKASKGK